jgi:glycosyltransferase involved in cell wall biosynthesis
MHSAEPRAHDAPPAVTVVIPTLNRPGTAKAAIQSVIDQVGVRSCVLVSENCSDPRFAAAYAGLFESLPENVRVMRQPVRLPVESHFQRMLEHVDTRYVVLLADDDVMAPSFLARAVALASDAGAGSVFGPYATLHRQTGRSRTMDFDYTHRSAGLRALHFLCRRHDAFIYGLFRTELLREAMAEFRPLVVLGRRTLTRIAYAPLFFCLLAAPYAHLHGDVVWTQTIDSVKNETYLGENRVWKLVVLVLGEWVLVARFLRLARAQGGCLLSLALAPAIVAMAVFHCAAFSMMACKRFVTGVTQRIRRA